MKHVTFSTLINRNGDSEFIEFVQSIPVDDRSKLFSIIDKIENHGIQVARSMKWIKKIDNNLYEIRSRRSSNIQRAIYFQKINSEFIITHGFTKKTQKTPPKEIKHAKRLIERYERGELNELNF